jgi:hypothetical protein
MWNMTVHDFNFIPINTGVQSLREITLGYTNKKRSSNTDQDNRLTDGS